MRLRTAGGGERRTGSSFCSNGLASADSLGAGPSMTCEDAGTGEDATAIADATDESDAPAETSGDEPWLTTRIINTSPSTAPPVTNQRPQAAPWHAPQLCTQTFRRFLYATSSPLISLRFWPD